MLMKKKGASGIYIKSNSYKDFKVDINKLVCSFFKKASDFDF